MLPLSDHCRQPVRPLLSFLGLKPQYPVPLRLPRSIATKDSSAVPPTVHDEPPRAASAPSEAQINGLGLAAQPVVPTMQRPSLLLGNRSFRSPFSQPQEDVAGAGISSASTFGLSHQPRLSTTHDQESGPFHQSRLDTCTNSALPQSTEPYTNTSIPVDLSKVEPVHSVSQHSFVDQSPYPLPHDLTLGYSQFEPVSQPGRQLGQPLSYQDLSHSTINATGAFCGAHNFIIKDSAFIDNSSESFMATLLKETIPGAEFDSSDPNMPLRCHQGTRLEIIKQCQDFVLNRERRPKIRWVVGAAGVGKSAVMQSVAHDEYNILSVATIIVGATIFFSINGRQDGTKAIMTVAYQLAVKLRPYRLFLQHEVADDPSLLRKSLSVQFKKFIIEPFINRRIPDCPSCMLIIIDGLDECANPSTQLELLGLISNFCISYPDSPLVWTIASRPEPHITSFFSQPKIAPLHEMEQMLIDSDDAHDDVKAYLRDKFKEVQIASITLRRLPRWPSEDDFSKIADASGGLFAYASTVVRYIDDPTYGDPVGQLKDVLVIMRTGTSANVSGEDHPMARLDALYAHIMSKIPAKSMANTRKLLLLYAWIPSGWGSFHFVCNMLGMMENDAYAATYHLQAVANIPGPDKALAEELTFFHKSFLDYLRDFSRSRFSPDIDSEVEHMWSQCGLRIIGETPECVKVVGASEDDVELEDVASKNGPVTGDNISVSWPVVGEDNDRELRLNMYREAVWIILRGLERREEAFQSLLCLRVFTTCFDILPLAFPFDAVSDSVFDESRRRELLNYGILKGVSLGTLENDCNWKYKFVRFHFRSTTLSDPWNASCQHEREGNWEGPGQDWSTDAKVVGRLSSFAPCASCAQRLRQHLKMQSPDRLVMVCDLTPIDFLAELRFVDPDDGVSEWQYYVAICTDPTYDE